MQYFTRWAIFVKGSPELLFLPFLDEQMMTEKANGLQSGYLKFLQRAHRPAAGPDLGIDAVLQVIEIAAPGLFNGHLSGALRVTDHVSE